MNTMKLFCDEEYAADCENKMNYVKLLWSDGKISGEDVISGKKCGEFPYIIKIAKKNGENGDVKKYARFEN